MMRSLLLILMLLASSICFAQSGVYKQLSAGGHIIYSDHYLKGAEQANLPELTVLPASQRPSKASPSIAKMEATDDFSQDHESAQIATHPSKATIHSAKLEKGAQSTETKNHPSDEIELSPEEQSQIIIDEMELHEDDIDRLELELYKIGADY